MPSPQLPFTFAWVDETDSTFDPDAHGVFDEDILSFSLKHEEGQIPTLNIRFRNPRIGLLNPGRKIWGWLAWQSPDTDPTYAGALVPLFFGVITSVPTDLFKEQIAIVLQARSPKFIAQKQALAEAMKVAPYYDPIWLDVGERDKPDSILEGWSAMWHVDRTSLGLTASDILEGEDGTLIFSEGQALYESVSLKLEQPPLNNIRVEGTVNWQQRSSGYVQSPDIAMSSYTGGTFLSDFPKGGASIGGGYKVQSSFVTDTYRVSQTPTASYSSQWTNTDPNPGQCSNASASTNSSGPALLSPNPLQCVLTAHYQSGLCQPFSDPPLNWPMTGASSGFVVPLWNIQGSMMLRYDASRQFSEIVEFDMIADTQAILASPLVGQNTELLVLSAVDVGQPLIDVRGWTTFAGQAVPLAQIIWPNDPTTPGGLAYQIAVQAGVAGSVEPEFSDVPTITTNDGSVIWASLGNGGITSAASWSPGTAVPLGQILLLQNIAFDTASGEFQTVPGATSYYICTRSGVTNGAYRDFTYYPPVQSNVETPPALRHISTIDPPNFTTTVGAIVNDGSVKWTVLGKNPDLFQIPIGGTPDDVKARSFFPGVRGTRALKYLLMRARARLRYRARAVKVGWTSPFELVVAASCRKNATLFDPRIPGGIASGKIISYELTAGGDGKLRGNIEIGVSVGYGGSAAQVVGEPTYVEDGYVEFGYQVYEGAMNITESNDIGYSPPVFVGFDDGLNFPLRWADISDGGRFSNDVASQKAAIEAAFDVMIQLQYVNRFGGGVGKGTSGGLTNATVGGVPPDVAWLQVDEQIRLGQQDVPHVMAANAVSWSLLLKPCEGNGPFNGAYFVNTSNLIVPQGIDLEAPSNI